MSYCKNIGLTASGDRCKCQSTLGNKPDDLGCSRPKSRCQGDSPCPKKMKSKNKSKNKSSVSYVDRDLDKEQELSLLSYYEDKRRGRPTNKDDCCQPIRYQEKQDRLMCGKHAINNLLGRKVVTNKYLDDSSKTVRECRIIQMLDSGTYSNRQLAEMVESLDQHYGLSRNGGNYDIKVVKHALTTIDNGTLIVTGAGYDPPDDVPLLDEREDFEARLDPNESNLIGIIMQLGGDPGHYVCAQAKGRHWCYIDSIDIKDGLPPRCLTTKELLHLLHDNDVRGYLKVYRSDRLGGSSRLDGSSRLGGLSNSDYKKKYYLYKKKYLELKKNLI